MYGPVKATCWSYVVGFSASNLLAYSSGTGMVIGITSAAATRGATAFVSLMIRVWSSGVSRPANGLSLEIGTGDARAPSISAKYEVECPDVTFVVNARSMAYLTSFEVTSRSTGGENFMPDFSLMVICLLSDDSSGSEAATSGTGLSASPGL